MSLRRTTCLILTAAIGVLLIVFPLATGMFSKAQGVDNLTDNFRDSFSQEAVASTRADMNTVVAMSDQMQNQMLPALPGALNMSPEQFQAFMGQNYPDAAAGIGDLNAIVPRFQAVVTGLEQQAPNFQKADAIPTKSLPALTVPYLFLVPGVLLVLVALGTLILGRGKPERQGGTRAGLAIALVVGLVFVIAPFALSLPSKAKAVDDLTGSFAATFSDQGVAQLQSDLQVVRTMSDQLATQTVPDLGPAMNMTPEQFGAFLNTQFPAVATGMSQINGILDRFDGFTAAIDANIGNFDKAASIPTAGTATTTLLYWFLIPGVALIVISAIALPAGTRPRAENNLDERSVRTVPAGV